jgi:uncharacterized protein (DUF1800 family)
VRRAFVTIGVLVAIAVGSTSAVRAEVGTPAAQESVRLLERGCFGHHPYPIHHPSIPDAVRFLEQATFGPTPAMIAEVRAIGFEGFLGLQFAARRPSYPDLGLWPSTPPATCDATCQRDNYSMYPLQRRFFTNALTRHDQLRQRVAFALNQIFVISGAHPELRLPSRMLPYLEVLDRHAFGSFRDLLTDVTLNAGMGRYLDMVDNNRSAPNENYARELLQLFSVGVNMLNDDGTLKLDASGAEIPTYDQATITAFARVFTGWTFAPSSMSGVPNYAAPMVPAAPEAHDQDPKTLLNGVTLPAGRDAATDLRDALDNVFAHPNVAPFISKNLIQHLVTSNPSPAYVGRVTQVFRRSHGNLRTVVRAILLDGEARHPNLARLPDYGHLREPVLWLTSLLRAFHTTGATTDFVLGDSFLPADVRMSQDVFRSPSVFNFFPPDHVVAGDDLLGPEFAIYTTATAIARINLALDVVFKTMPTSTDRPLGTWIDFTHWKPLGADPGRLVTVLDHLMLHGTMPSSMREVVVRAVRAIPASDPLKRVRTAVYLVATSPYYLVER